MAAKKTSAKKLTKSSFVRSQPPEMSAAEIVAKGKAAGMPISDSLVYMVRGPKIGSAKKTGAVKRSVSKKASPKKAKKTSSAPKSASPKKAGESKADFVRANRSLSANEIAAKAKAEGLTLDANYVYKVRGADKAAAKQKRVAKKAASTPMVTKTSATSKAPTSKPVSSNGTRPSGSASSIEDLLKAVASELGLGRAMEILAGERARVRAVMGG